MANAEHQPSSNERSGGQRGQSCAPPTRARTRSSGWPPPRPGLWVAGASGTTGGRDRSTGCRGPGSRTPGQPATSGTASTGRQGRDPGRAAHPSPGLSPPRDQGPAGPPSCHVRSRPLFGAASGSDWWAGVPAGSESRPIRRPGRAANSARDQDEAERIRGETRTGRRGVPAARHARGTWLKRPVMGSLPNANGLASAGQIRNTNVRRTASPRPRDARRRAAGRPDGRAAQAQVGGLPVTWRVARLTFAVFCISRVMNSSSSDFCSAVRGVCRFANSAQTSTR
jgi:hypothetical protein